MSRQSLPIKRFDGSVTIEPLRPSLAAFGLSSARRHNGPRRGTPADAQVQRAKILRDIAILVLLAVTILAGSAVVIGTLWRDAAVAESQARMVEAERSATVRLAEAELSAAHAGLVQKMIIILAAAGIAIILLMLARPGITPER